MEKRISRLPRSIGILADPDLQGEQTEDWLRRSEGPAMLVDTHCHLYLLEEGVEGVLARARGAGVGHLVDVGIDLETSRRAAANAARFEGVSASAGVHPHEAESLTPATLEGSTPWTAATVSAVIATRSGLLGRPRKGWGVRKGLSVSSTIRSSGTTAQASRSLGAFLKVTVPAKDT